MSKTTMSKKTKALLVGKRGTGETFPNFFRSGSVQVELKMGEQLFSRLNQHFSAPYHHEFQALSLRQLPEDIWHSEKQCLP
ncbi:MAG: hypothetical protein ABL967_17525 [Bryobacteraceae bacterium]